MSTIIRFALVVIVFSGVLVVAFMHERLTPAIQPTLINNERYIAIIIPSYNNSRWYTYNLSTIFKQNYNNYHVFYIDDCSTDNTYEYVRQFITACGQKDHVTLIKNNKRYGALYNIYRTIRSCPDHAIIVTLDGDDWLKGNDVLSTINRAYADPNVWLTYGQFEEFPRGSLGICHPMPSHVISEKSYRKQHWFTSHLRTFYAGLFKRIAKEDLMLNDNFFSVAWDQAFMFPMLEMADGHILFIDKIMYVYNQANPLNDFKVRLRDQLWYERIIRNKKQYDPLHSDEARKFVWA